MKPNHLVLSLVLLVNCGQEFQTFGDQPPTGAGGNGGQDDTTQGVGGTLTIAVGTGGTSDGGSSSSVSPSSAASSVASSVSSTAASSVASSSSTGGGGPTPQEMYDMFCVDVNPMDPADNCDAAHGNCHCVLAKDCPFQCAKTDQYCCTIWLVSNMCTLGGGKGWKFVGYVKHDEFTFDQTYCAP